MSNERAGMSVTLSDSRLPAPVPVTPALPVDPGAPEAVSGAGVRAPSIDAGVSACGVDAPPSIL